MTWVYLTNAERNKISRLSGPYIVDGYEPHESAVRQVNPRDDWKGLEPDERKEMVDKMPKPFMVADLFAKIEEQLKARNT